MINKFKKLNDWHWVSKNDNFTISYAITSDYGANMGIKSFIGDEDDETAIVIDDDYLILNGDHRKGYSKCKNLSECKKYYKSHQDQVSSWSTK